MINLAHKTCPHNCRIKLILALAVTLTLAAGTYSGANDAAVEVTTGGLVLKQEERISIEKETLYISLNKIEVSYEFRNNSDKDVTTEIAFPVPDYRYLPEHPLGRVASFRDFTVYVNGKETLYRKEAKAFLNGKDCSGILKEMDITIDDFGGFDAGDSIEVLKLNETGQNKLVKLGLLDQEEKFPLWTVKMQYHWTQTFPAGKSVTVRHTYSPYWGFQSFAFGRSWADDRNGEKKPPITTGYR